MRFVTKLRSFHQLLWVTTGSTIATTGNSALQVFMQLDTILLKVASRCNINCSYCYVFNQGDTGWKKMPKVMSNDTVQDVIRALGDLYEDQKRPFAIVLHGGEPLLLPRDLLKTLLEGIALNLPPTCSKSIQTNGILIDDDLLDLCARTETTISISIDGPADVHDVFRIAFDGSGTYTRAAAGIERVSRHRDVARIFTGALCVVDPYSNPRRIYDFFKSLKVPSVDFLFKDGNYAKFPLGKRSFDSIENGEWLAAIWDCYVADPEPPRIRILDDIARLLLGGSSVKEGCGKAMYGIAVVETDGSLTKNDTLKSTFDGADRFEEVWSVSSHRFAEIASTSEFVQYSQLQTPTSHLCQLCPVLSVCGGGMPLSRWHPDTGLDNPSVYCADYKFLIKHIDSDLQNYR